MQQRQTQATPMQRCLLVSNTRLRSVSGEDSHACHCASPFVCTYVRVHVCVSLGAQCPPPTPSPILTHTVSPFTVFGVCATNRLQSELEERHFRRSAITNINEKKRGMLKAAPTVVSSLLEACERSEKVFGAASMPHEQALAQFKADHPAVGALPPPLHVVAMSIAGYNIANESALRACACMDVCMCIGVFVCACVWMCVDVCVYNLFFTWLLLNSCACLSSSMDAVCGGKHRCRRQIYGRCGCLPRIPARACETGR